MTQIKPIPLAHLPTPLEELHALSKLLEGPRIFMKRDDCTGLAGGGNKTRKLEYLIADAIANGCDTLITAGGVQSNHCRQTAAAATCHGLACHLVLVQNVKWDDPAYLTSGNLPLDRLLGAEVVIHGPGSDRDQIMSDLAAKLTKDGRKPYLIPVGGSNSVGALGYVAAVPELLDQCADQNITPSALYFCTSSGGTQVGLIAGMIQRGRPFPIIGVGNEADSDQVTNAVTSTVPEVLEYLESGAHMQDTDVRIVDGFGGPAYGIPNKGTLEAMEMTAQTEGILLDPVYTGKGMAGLISDIRAGKYAKDDTVIFLHTGGAQSLGAYTTLFDN
jgi:L-cysteate sulfo-lyase